MKWERKEKKGGETFPSFFYTFILYKLAQRPPASNPGRWKLVITKVRFWGYSIEWQLGGLGQVLDVRWMEPVWAAHYRRTSAALRPPDSASSFTLTLGCRVNACERPEAEQNHTHTHTHACTTGGGMCSYSHSHLLPTVAVSLRIKV